MNKDQTYQTSTYISVCLLADLAADFWALPEDDINQVFNFLHKHGDTGYLEWLSQWRSCVDKYMVGSRSRSAILKKHPEQHAFFEYARWRILQNGALTNSLLVQYGYARTCSAKGAFQQSEEFLNLLLSELTKLNCFPPSPFDCGDELNRLRT